MASESAYAAGDPHQLLSRARELAQRVRRAQRATWFPLLVFAAVTFAAIPVDRFGGHGTTCRTFTLAGPSGLPGRVCTVYSTAAFVYWPIALVLAYVAIAAFYLHRSRARGVGTRVQPYVIAGIVVAVVVSGAALWAAHHPLIRQQDVLGLRFGPGQASDLFHRVVGPACAIGLALLVLAWAERSRALLAFTVGYLAIVLIPINFGWVITLPSQWAFLPHVVIAGSVLLIGGVGFAVAERPARSRAA